MKIITGMHRSGTSIVARLLHAAGADFGDSRTFHPADEWNPDGYYEQRTILTLNRKLLEGRWGKFANIFPPSNARVLKRGQDLAGEICAAVEMFRGCTIKDPRFNYTGPAWEEHGAQIEKIVVCLREPLDVARSMQKRNRLPVAVGLHVWTDCLQRLLSNYGTHPMWVVEYERLIDARTCVAEIAGLFRYLDLPMADQVDHEWAQVHVRFAPHGTAVNVYPPKLEKVRRHFKSLAALQRSGAP